MNDKHVYPLKFNKWLYLLAPAVILLTVPAIIMAIINMTRMHATEGYYIALDIVVVVLCLCILLLALSALFLARYEVKKGCLYCSLGIFYNRIPVSRIVEITRYPHLGKLAVFYKNGNFVKQIIVSISENQYDDFIDTLKKLNKDISYVVDSDDFGEK